ncbi:MAG: sporulation protein YqfC [Clostridia bacterium]|jgi:sporulation protein YqfC|nr:sporulation protein YqfC [Clostridia bacterium]MCI1999939.1 sporulation protein YqfC [Clostridia bacterium]MCI2014527.1 sporulation protein YqfC [Clostridia bacterium]
MESIKKKFSRMLDIPQESVLNVPYITVTGREQLSIENFGGILEYLPDNIKLKTSIGIIEIKGNKMNIKSMSDKSMTINGTILCVEFSE